MCLRLGMRTCHLPIDDHRLLISRLRHLLFGMAARPTRIDFGGANGGSLRLAGRYGPGMAVQARLDRLDLQFANALLPNLGIAGQATGSLDFAQATASSFPTADARLTIACPCGRRACLGDR